MKDLSLLWIRNNREQNGKVWAEWEVKSWGKKAEGNSTVGEYESGSKILRNKKE